MRRSMVKSYSPPQTQLASESGHDVVAMDNVGHLGRFIVAESLGVDHTLN